MERTLLQTLASHAAVAIAGADQRGRITYCSPALLGLLGLDHVPDTDLSWAALPLYREDRVTRLGVEDLPLVRARRGEVVRDQLMVVARPGEGLRFLRNNATPILDPRGAVEGAVCLVQDVTNEYGAQLREAHLRDRLIETVNHQLRTPLTAALGHAELLVDMSGLPDRARRSATALYDAMLRLTALVEQVSELVDLEAAGNLSASFGDVVPQIAGRVRAARVLSSRRRVRIDYRHPPELLMTADFGQLGRAVGALLDNAVQYSPARSMVGVRVAGDNQHVRISVRDRGNGIPRAERARLVHPFEVADHPQRRVDSRGLGLALANRIATAHGGHLDLGDARPGGLAAAMVLPRYGAVPRPAPFARS